MKTKTTILWHLMIIPMLLIGMHSYAQKGEKSQSQRSATQELTTTSSASLELEQAFQAALHDQSASGNAVKAKSPAEKIAEKKARKIALMDIIANNPANNVDRVGEMLVPKGTSLPDPTDDPWDIVFNVHLVVVANTAIETNGDNIFVGIWNPTYSSNNLWSRYDMSGNFIEYFNITGWAPSGTNGPRDMDYDGTVFYATNATSTIYKMDLVNKVVVGTIATSVAGARHFCINDDNGHLFTGDWYGLHELDPSGSTLTNWSSTVSAIPYYYGSAYDNYSDGGPYIHFYSQYPSGSTDGRVYKYDLNTHTLNTTWWFETHTIPGIDPLGLAGGLTSTALLIPGKFCLLGMSQSGSGTGDDMWGVELANTVTFDFDAGIASIIKPNSGINLTNAEQVKVAIKNYGNLPLTNIPVQFKLGANPPVNETWTGTLIPGDTVHYTFTATIDVHIYNTYSITCRTLYPGDMYPNNDPKTKTFQNIIPNVTDTLYPGNAPYWTGTTDGLTFTQTSLIYGWANSPNDPVGWAKFDMSAVPNGVTLNSATLYMYAIQPWNYPYFNLQYVNLDPMISTPAQVSSAIKSGLIYMTFTEYIDGLIPVWVEFDLPASALAHITAGTFVDYYTVGVYDPEGSTWQASFEGWAETHVPYLIINYDLPLEHDVMTVSVNLPPYVMQGAFTPTATVANIGSAAETFQAIITGPNGYTDTQTINALAPGSQFTVTFATATLTPGTACFTVCTSLATDLNGSNDCKTACMSVDETITQAYGIIVGAVNPTPVPGTYKFLLEHPGPSFTNIGTSVLTSPNFISAGAWANGVWYGAEYFYPSSGYLHGHLYSIDTATGVYNDIGPLGWQIMGMSYDQYTGTMWGVGPVDQPGGTYGCQLYSIDLNSGVASLVKDFGTNIGLVINGAFNDNGMLYIADIVNDRTFAIDPIQQWYELMGPTNVNLNFAQDAEWNKANNKLYAAAFDYNSYLGGLYLVDPGSGEYKLIETLAGGQEVCGFAIPWEYTAQTTDVGVQWIVYPKSGNLTSAEPVVLKVRNYGLTPASNFNLCFKYGTTTHCENWSSIYPNPLAPGDTALWYFTTSLNLTATGKHCFKAWTSGMLGDNFVYNDTAYKCPVNYACGAITCLPNYINEPEQCGDDNNHGCYGTPNQFIDIQNGQVYCGTLWKVDTIRDIDVYRFTVTGNKSITIKGRSEYNMQVQIRKLPCGLDSLVTSKVFTKCTLDSLVTALVGPGTYVATFAIDFADFNTVCNGNTKYTFQLMLANPKYCNASHSYSCGDEHIIQVNFGLINNSSGCGLSSGGVTGYSNYTALSTDLQLGNVYPITVYGEPTYSGDIVVVWIDWNQDYDFYDVGEKYATTATLSTPMLFAGTIVVPNNAAPGQTRMRIREAYSYTFANMDPCAAYSYGECEDYTVNVIVPIPPIVTTAPTLSGVCAGTKTIPITVQNCNNINAFDLKLETPGVSLLGYQNVNPALAGGAISVSSTGTTVLMTWYSPTLASVGDGTLLELVVAAPSGTTPLTWYTTGLEGSQYSNATVGVLPSTWVNGEMTYGNCTSLDGTVKYAKKTLGNPTPILMNPVVNVNLWSGLTLAYTTTIDASGYFSFPSLNYGTYTLSATTAKPHGGINATDALLILSHFVQQSQLTGIWLTAADVNGSTGVPNAADALAVSRRFVGQIPSFQPPYVPPPGSPDWFSSSITVVVDGTANQTKEILMVCSGDVNGSYTPPSPKLEPTVSLRTEGSIQPSGQTAIVPVNVESNMSVGAVSLVLDIPANLEVTGASVANNPENLVYKVADGKLRLAWFGTEPLDLKAGETLLSLTVKINSFADATFAINAESELSNESGTVIENAGLTMPKLVSTAGIDDYSLSNLPNPFRNTTQISYSLPQSGSVTLKVFNVLGEEIATLVNASQNSGKYMVTFDGSTLPRGVYVVKLQSGDITRAKSMVISE